MRCEYVTRITSIVLIIICLVNEMVSEPRFSWAARRRRRRYCKPVDCIPGEWSPWSDCSHTCGPNGHSTTRRKIIKPAQCGGKCLVTTVGARACNRFCLNGGTLIRSSCHCKNGYKGECCSEMGELKKFQNLFRDQFFEQSVAAQRSSLALFLHHHNNCNQRPQQTKNSKILYIAINNATLLNISVSFFRIV